VTTTSVTDLAGALLATVTRLVEPSPAGGMLTVIAIDGDIDHDTAAVVRGVLVEALDESRRVLCDLSRVSFFSAAAAHAVLAAHRHATGLGRPFLLRGVGGLTLRVLKVAQLTHIIGSGRADYCGCRPSAARESG